MPSKIMWSAILASAMAAAVTLTSCMQNDPQAASTKISTQEVKMGDLTLGLTADGTVTLPVSNLNFQVEGIIKKMYVSEGATVKEGDLLAELDDSDFQLKITEAQNALDKAKANYEQAVQQRDMSLMSDEKTLDDLLKKINKPFDDYTYRTAVTDAQKTLERKQTALEEARAAAENPFDDYTYKNTIADALNTLNKRKAELAAITNAFDDYTYQNNISDALANVEKKKADLAAITSGFDDYTYQNSISDTTLNLEKKKNDLMSAQTALEEAKTKDYSTFDDYTYQNNINTAYTNYQRKYDDAESAREKKNSADVAFQQASESGDQSAADAAYGALDQAQKAYSSAVQARDDAYASWMKAETELERAKSSAADNVTKTREDAIKAAQDKVTAATTAVEDAQRSLDKANTDLSRAKANYDKDIASKIETAESAVADAQKSYEKALKDLDRAKASYEKDNTTKIESAKTAVADAQRSYDKAVTDMERARANAADDAQKKLTDAKNAVTDAEDSLSKAKMNLIRAKADYVESVSDTQGNYDQQKISYENSKSSTQSITDAEYNISSAELNLEEAIQNLEKTKLYASKDGQIISISKSEGEKVSAQVGNAIMNFGTNSGSGIVTLCDVSQIYLSANVSEGDIVGLSLDQTVNVTIDSIGDQVFYGKVYNISNVPSTDSNGITTYKVTVKLDELNTEIRDGMNALMNFVKKELKDVMLIPVKAVFVEDNTQYVNVVLADGTYEKRQVVTGLANSTQTQVISGLTVGETVLNGKLKT